MDKIKYFKTDISNIEIPKKFTFPFYYEAHHLAKIAADELQKYLENQNDFAHNFSNSSNSDNSAIGKMFGVLVIKDNNGKIAYLSSFSGKLAESNKHKYFVPPIFDLLDEQSFFKKEEDVINSLNKQIEEIYLNKEYKKLILEKEKINVQFKKNISEIIIQIKKNKETRNIKRYELNNSLISDIEKEKIINILNNESKNEQIKLKIYKKKFKDEILKIDKEIKCFHQQIDLLSKKRAEKSMLLQKKIFENYSFLNAKNESKSLLQIFNDFKNELPPAGAGECAAPKLLQYAYKNKLTPICLAEFWWGDSPPSEVRKHKQFYPSCKSKCEPILSFMLNGLKVDTNPFIEKINKRINYSIIFEDDYILAINKPENCLSVPGKNKQNSIYSQIKAEHKDWTGPLLVHRLDYSTSGILLIAKNLEVYKKIQKQFIKRVISKKYIAIIDGKIESKIGIISIPLRVDLNDRPRQVVCYEYGKEAITEFEVIEYLKNNKTKILFTPITGRTHQLRVHSSHHLGLNTPILGDDLYGKKDKRLYLHAFELNFFHPISNEKICLKCDAKF